jgi:uroporphyrinogen-III decarboxylase
MTSEERVLAACAFEPADKVPRFDSFWELPEEWKHEFGDNHDLSDIQIWAADEAPFPSAQHFVKEENGCVYAVDGWGSFYRTRASAYFKEILEVAMPEGVDPDAIRFESAESAPRYLMGRKDAVQMVADLAAARRDYCVFVKTGGPFLRTTFLRGEKRYLMDIAEDPDFARALAEKTAAHIEEVGVQSIKRWGLSDTGIWIYDDMAYNDAPLFSPKAFERIFLPAYRKMIARYREAGAKYVFFHSDGNINPFVEMLIDAGIDGLHPLERRAGVDPFLLRRRYPRLILAGGMCNTDTLVNGPIDRIKSETRRLLELARNGGMIIGTHSVSPEIPLAHFKAYDETCRIHGISE